MPEEEEIPDRETVKQKMWEAEKAIRELDAKAKEISEAIQVFIGERNFWRNIAMQYYPELAVKAVPQQKRLKKIKALPREFKEVMAVIRAYEPKKKEWIASEVAEIYNREVKDVVAAMLQMFKLGMLYETNGKVEIMG